MKQLSLASFLLVSFLASTPTFALDSESYNIVNNENVTLSAGKTVTGDYFAAGEQVEISGTVTGDAYVAGGLIIVNGTINGDLLVAGGQIKINGIIEEDLRAAGGQITINGTVGKNISVAGGNVDIAKEAVLGGNVVVGSGNLTIAAPVPGDVKAGAGNVTLNNRVDNNVIAGVGQLNLTSTGRVGGDIVYWSENPDDLVLAEGATVSGIIEHKNVSSQVEKWREDVNAQTIKDAMNDAFSIFRLGSLIGMILVGFLLIHFFPEYSLAAIKTIENKGWPTVLLGFAALILTPFVIIFLLFSLIGIPVAILLAIIYGVLLYLSKIIFAYWLGARLIHRLQREAGKTITFLIGAGTYYVLTSVAIVGPIMIFLATIFGLGAILFSSRNLYLNARQSRLF